MDAQPYRLSEFFHTQPHRRHVLAYHSFFGNGLRLTGVMLAALNRFRAPRPLPLRGPLRPLTERWVQLGWLVPADVTERRQVLQRYRQPPPRISTVVLNVTYMCNFRCAHCLSSKAHACFYPDVPLASMEFKTACQAIDWVAGSLAGTGQTLNVSFNGGEPLLRWSWIQKVVAYAESRRGGVPIRLTIHTNAALMTPGIARFFLRRRFDVCASLDGPQAGNDLVRRNARGQGTYARILRGFDCLTAAGLPVRAAHGVLTDANALHWDEACIRDLKARGFLSLTLEPDFTAPLKLEPAQLVERLMQLRQVGQAVGMTVIGLWERPYAAIIREGINTQTHFCHDLAGDTISVLPDGTLCACAFSPTPLGHVKDAIRQGTPADFQRSSSVRRLIERRRAGRILTCRGCEIEGVCAGGCYVIASYARQQKSRYHCEFYRLITRRLLLAADSR